MELAFTTVETIGLGRTAEVLTRAFADYLVPLSLSETALQGMALLPEVRGQGVGRRVMERVIDEARARGARELVLEVIEQNTAAVRLYERMGFKARRRLLGFEGKAPAGLPAVNALGTAIVTEVAAAVRRMDAEIGWPWQISAETIAQLPPSTVAHTLDEAWIVLSRPSGPTIGVRAFAVDGAERRAERAARLLQAVMAKYAAEQWRMSALWPEELAEWFTRAHWTRQELSQWQMRRSLQTAAGVDREGEKTIAS